MVGAEDRDDGTVLGGGPPWTIVDRNVGRTSLSVLAANRNEFELKSVVRKKKKKPGKIGTDILYRQ